MDTEVHASPLPGVQTEPNGSIPRQNGQAAAVLTARPSRPPPLPSWFAIPLVGAICALWGASVWVSVHVVPDPTLHDVALFAHLAALVGGFGAVLVIDWIGFLWVLGRRTFMDLMRTADAVHVMIWASLAALTASGALLHPDTSSIITRVKLALVLIIALNGLHAHALQRRLERFGDAPPPPWLVARSGLTAMVSQVSWWVAMFIGFHNHQS